MGIDGHGEVLESSSDGGVAKKGSASRDLAACGDAEESRLGGNAGAGNRGLRRQNL